MRMLPKDKMPVDGLLRRVVLHSSLDKDEELSNAANARGKGDGRTIENHYSRKLKEAIETEGRSLSVSGNDFSLN